MGVATSGVAISYTLLGLSGNVPSPGGRSTATERQIVTYSPLHVPT